MAVQVEEGEALMASTEITTDRTLESLNIESTTDGCFGLVARNILTGEATVGIELPDPATELPWWHELIAKAGSVAARYRPPEESTPRQRAAGRAMLALDALGADARDLHERIQDLMTDLMHLAAEQFEELDHSYMADDAFAYMSNVVSTAREHWVDETAESEEMAERLVIE